MDILYEDESLLVVKKPAGIPVQTSRVGMQDMVSILKNYRATRKEQPYIGLVHRLDQPVEGVMVFAKTKQAAGDLSCQAAGNAGVQMDKEYCAVVCIQNPSAYASKGTLTDYLLRDGKTNLSKVVPSQKAGAKKAVLHYEIQQKRDNLAKIQIYLETGRHHQIRVQMANAHFPLVGDQKYGTPDCMQVEGAGKDIALCSVKIAFRHPVTKQQMEFCIEPQNKTFQIFS